ncbi:OmpA family protein [Acidobacteria bacterium ACD]|nr:MAG: OmpA family protein [Acidobacteriota bacterium]MDL1952506.1 OmpA family protein [Acidobacteria bacterium ACD]
MKRSTRLLGILGLASAAAIGLGCATTKDVDQRIAEAQSKTDKKIESVETQVEDLQEKQKATDGKLEQQDKKIEELSQSASEALKRAQEAGVLAKGKVVFEQTFTEDRIRFRVSSAQLDDKAKETLDEFAVKVRDLKRPVWIEIQGHTDNTGTEEINDQLGAKRAESVRLYLARKHQLPIPRMTTISYGDTLPVEPNKSSKGRAANRRVVVVVME